MSLRTASFQASYTTGILDSTSVKVQEEEHGVTLSKTLPSTQRFAVYSWEFNYIDDNYAEIVTDIAAASEITDMKLSFRYNNNVDGVRIVVNRYTGDDPKIESAETIIGIYPIDEIAEVELIQTNQTSVTVDLNDVGSFYADSLSKINSRDSVNVLLFRDTSLTSGGSVDVSGQTLVGGTTEWRAASDTEPIDAPLLIITYEIATESHPLINMKYTTLDPTAIQSTPASSLGSYVAVNRIYASGDIAESINSTQTTIPISTAAATGLVTVDDASVMPTTTGLASVGPEIFKFTSIDTTNNKLTGITRGIAPDAFPAGFDSFKIAEKVQYLTDLNQLFDTRPSSGLSQYRCVAIVNDGGAGDPSAQDITIGITQDADADVQIRIGVEVPKFDNLGVTCASGTTTTVAQSIVSEADGFYDGAAIYVSSLAIYAIVTSYTSDGEFLFDRTITGLSSGTRFTILPAAAQRITSDAIAPTTNSGLFGGFSEDASGISVTLQQHGTTAQENDLFYVWIRRTLKTNIEETNDTGAVLTFRYREV